MTKTIALFFVDPVVHVAFWRQKAGVQILLHLRLFSHHLH